MSQSKSKGVKVHSKSSSEKLSSDSQGSKHKARTLNSKRQFSSTKPARKASPQGNHTYGSVTNGEGVVEDLKSKAEIEKINLKTLQNIDGEIAKILSVIPWVELYQYRDSENMWERTAYEGTLFVYSKDPSCGGGRGFVILNRLNSDNTQEELVPGMEFREQSPFLLYKRDSGEIFGLCIKDEKNFTLAGKLLNSSSSSPCDGSSMSPSPYTTGGSQSPVSRSEGPPASSEESAGVHTSDLVLQEVASRNYLGGQCFSDDTEGSIDGVDLSSSPVASEREDYSGKQLNLNTSSLKLPHSAFKTLPNGGNLPGSNSPHSFHRATKQTTPMKGSIGETSKSKSSWKKQSNSPDAKQKLSGGVTPVSRSKPSAVQHAASLDNGRVRGNASYDQFNTAGQVSNGLSSSYNESSPFLARIGERSNNSSALHASGVSLFSASSKTSDDSIVRKLFPPRASSETLPASAAGGISPAVQTLFSAMNDPVRRSVDRAAPCTSVPLSSSLGSSQNKMGVLPGAPYPSSNTVPLPESALSVNELEKQMNEENSNSLAMPSHRLDSNLLPSSDREHRVPANASVPVGVASSRSHHAHLVSNVGSFRDEKIHSSILKQAMVVDEPALARENVRLLQPSVFSVHSTPVAAASTATTVTTASQKPLLLPCSIANMAAITLEPPTPVSIPSKSSAEGGFPSIPPLMHSPGMTAPPLSASTGTKVAKKASRGNSEGLVRRSATVDSDPASAGGSQISSPSPELGGVQTVSGGGTSVPRRSLTMPNPTALMSPQQFLESRGRISEDIQKPPVDSLSKEQFQKTLMYLVQNDESFIDKIYKTHQLLVQLSAQDTTSNFS